jgi:hypothetical protein
MQLPAGCEDDVIVIDAGAAHRSRVEPPPSVRRNDLGTTRF